MASTDNQKMFTYISNYTSTFSFHPVLHIGTKPQRIPCIALPVVCNEHLPAARTDRSAECHEKALNMAPSCCHEGFDIVAKDGGKGSRRADDPKSRPEGRTRSHDPTARSGQLELRIIAAGHPTYNTSRPTYTVVM